MKYHEMDHVKQKGNFNTYSQQSHKKKNLLQFTMEGWLHAYGSVQGRMGRNSWISVGTVIV